MKLGNHFNLFKKRPNKKWGNLRSNRICRVKNSTIVFINIVHFLLDEMTILQNGSKTRPILT